MVTVAGSLQKTISPVDGRVYVERELATPAQINDILRTARHAFAAWRNVSLADRAAVLTRFCDEFEARRDEIAAELTWQMGRPSRYAPSEVRGTLERARHMIAIAPQALADIGVDAKELVPGHECVRPQTLLHRHAEELERRTDPQNSVAVALGRSGDELRIPGRHDDDGAAGRERDDTDVPLRRRYWEVVTAGGRNLIVYRDLVRGRWYTQR